MPFPMLEEEKLEFGPGVDNSKQNNSMSVTSPSCFPTLEVQNGFFSKDAVSCLYSLGLTSAEGS